MKAAINNLRLKRKDDAADTAPAKSKSTAPAGTTGSS